MKFVGLVIVVGCAFMRALEVWAVNAWDIGLPLRLLGVGAVLSVLGLALYWIGLKAGLETLPAAIAAGGVVLVLMLWSTLAVHPVLWLGIAIAVPWFLLSDLSPRANRLVVTLTLGLVLVYPIVNLVTEHVTNTEKYAILEPAPRVEATPTGAAEDLILIVPDSYPAPVIAEEWFGHDMEPLRTVFEEEGFVWAEAGLSRHTFTLLMLSSMYELQPVVDDSPTPPWGNLTSLFEIAGGDSYLRHALAGAGFNYIHVESGFDGTKCGRLVDECHRAGLLDESTWNLLVPSVFYGYLAERHGSYSVDGTLRATDDALDILERVQGNGEHDFVFVHLLLPHPPVVVDESCKVITPEGDPVVTGPDSPFTAGFERQLGCVDLQLERLAKSVEDTSAVLITADHGSGLGGQVSEAPEEWSDADIAERFSILLTYRMPGSCPGPVEATNLDAMRALVACVVEMEMPPRSTGYLIGALDPKWVDPGRMEGIIDQMRSGSPPLPDDGLG